MKANLLSQSTDISPSPNNLKLLDYLHDMTAQLSELAEMGDYNDIKLALDEALICIRVLR